MTKHPKVKSHWVTFRADLYRDPRQGEGEYSTRFEATFPMLTLWLPCPKKMRLDCGTPKCGTRFVPPFFTPTLPNRRIIVTQQDFLYFPFMQNTLLSWIGAADLKATRETEGSSRGPVAQAVQQLDLAQIHLLSNYPEAESKAYVDWLRSTCDATVELVHVKLKSPVDFGDIYQAAKAHASRVTAKHQNSQLCLHLSPGTPAMAAVWLLLGKTKYNARFIQSSPEQGAAFVDIPFDISAEFIPDILRPYDERLAALSTSAPRPGSGFADIVYRSPQMAREVERAEKAAPRSIPVLIEGESGTGKELFANAIHHSSPRRDKPFIAVNCGAIPQDLIESELFGHVKGAFTGASAGRKGHFQMAHGGTIFLDEIGELPPAAQVKLLRVLQEKAVTPIGASKTITVDVRVIAATNRDLLDDSRTGQFRADLFYRLAVAILKLPPLREREGDLGLLIDTLLNQVNEESKEDPGYKDKKISARAKNLLTQHPWPGNVRELLNTLRRIAIWTDSTTIDEAEVRDALLSTTALPVESILNRPLGENLELPEIIAEVAKHYLSRAMQETSGNKTKAASLLGLPNYQTLTNWLKKYDVEH